MTSPRPHEFHLVGNISACKHCKRAEHMLNPRRGDECAARLRAQLDDVERAYHDAVGHLHEAHLALPDDPEIRGPLLPEGIRRLVARLAERA